uniref:MFS domain-containing protein n=1 Tax=Macrostomum lignano TaxID=282301 RepID=A0A1I8FTD5_9PLAT
ERDAWAYENAVLQARLADLAQRAERQAGVEAAYRSWKLAMMLRRKAETAAAAGDQATQQQVDQLVNELAALKRDLERLQHRYRTERDRWSARRRELEKAIDDLIAGKDPKAVQKRLKAAEAAEPKAEELHRSGFDPVADDDDLATATMAYYSSANTVKKEKAVLELELEDEKRKNRQNKKARGEAADDGEAEGAAGSRDADLPLEKGSVEASEKRRDSRRPSETPKQAAVQQKLNEAHEELKAAAEERDQARAEGERLKAENERRREENKRMKDELVRAAEQEKANEERKRDAEEKARLEDENRELKDKLDKQRRENDAEVDKLKQEKRRLEDKLRNIRDKMADGQKNYKHFQGEFEELAKLCEISSLCLITYLVPCYTFGMNAEAVGENCFVCGLGMVCGLSFILGPMIRSKIRERQGIPGSFMADCCIWFFCGFCALVQEGLEVKTFAARPQRIERE